MLEETAETPVENVPVPNEVPLTVSEPELVVTVDPPTTMPQACSVPFAAVPVIVTLPVPVAEMLADDNRKTAMEPDPVHEVPLTVSEPELVVTLDPSTWMPRASVVPFAAVPVIVTVPVPVAEMLEEPA